MAQTAVSWLVSEIRNHINIPFKHFDELLEQAKAMEKEQIEEAYAHGSNDRLKNRMIEYYNEKYGGEK